VTYGSQLRGFSHTQLSIQTALLVFLPRPTWALVIPPYARRPERLRHFTDHGNPTSQMVLNCLEKDSGGFSVALNKKPPVAVIGRPKLENGVPFTDTQTRFLVIGFVDFTRSDRRKRTRQTRELHTQREEIQDVIVERGSAGNYVEGQP